MSAPKLICTRRFASVISTALTTLFLLTGTALGQATQTQVTQAASASSSQPAPEKPKSDSERELSELKGVVVTGTRIRETTNTTSPAPVTEINSEVLTERGFTQAGQALSELTSNALNPPNLPALPNGLELAGQDLPNLFNLGVGRTLTLVNGLRMVSSSSGLGDQGVDSNIVPTGLLERIDVVQAGGAAVYGSGAIAGVINYVLQDHFQGVKANAQFSMDSRHDYPVGSFTGVVGRNFADNKGNVAAEFDYSNTGYIQSGQRPNPFMSSLAATNQTPGAGTGNIPSTVYVPDWYPIVGNNGLVVTSPYNPLPSGVLQINGAGRQINSSGNLVPANIGTPIPGSPYFVTGGNLGRTLFTTGTVVPKVEREIGNILAHYNLTDNIKLSNHLLIARTQSTQPNEDYEYSQYYPLTGGVFPGRLEPFPFYNTNPYLSAATVAALSTAYPQFAAGQPLYLAKLFTNQDPQDGNLTETATTYYDVISLDGAFNAMGRDFYWDTSASDGQTQTSVVGYEGIVPNIYNAADTIRNSAGKIVCAINNPVVTSPCVPINIFGTAPLTQAQYAYIDGLSGTTSLLPGNSSIGPVTNKQDDFLGTLGGDLVELPGGEAQFAVTYEHRGESADFTPLPDDLLGEFYTGVASVAGSGSYHTDEGALEFDLPMLGKEHQLPLVKAFDLNASYRFVKNSLTGGSQSVWGTGLRWDTDGGLTIRATMSRNFRAPDIAQVVQPSSVGLGSVNNPCSNTYITSGPAPATRAANCLALFTANPTFGLNSLPSGVANTPANRLANFVGTLVTSTVTNTTGNPALRDEISNTWTVGFVFRPPVVPGLSVSADHITLRLTNALTLYTVSDFADTCFDSSPRQSSYCNSLSYDAEGDITGGVSTTVNAGSQVLHAEIYNLNYEFDVGSMWKRLSGAMDVNIQGTHTGAASTTVAGVTTLTNDTTTNPTWVGKLDLSYVKGPVHLNYTFFYLPSVLLTATSTVANSPSGITHLSANRTHNISAAYDFGSHYSVTAGINDIFDKLPSFPTTYGVYGNPVGRQFFVSAALTF